MESLNKNRLKAVHDDDLTGLLEQLGVLNKLRRGEIQCNFCRAVITLENLHSLYPFQQTVRFVCDKPACVKALSQYLEERANTNNAP